MRDDIDIATRPASSGLRCCVATRSGSGEHPRDGESTRRVSTANSRAAQRHVDQAVVALRAGKRDRAVALIEAAISLDPDNRILLANRDRLLASRRRER